MSRTRRHGMIMLQCVTCLALSRAVSAGEPSAKPVDPSVEKICTEFARKIEATISASDPGPCNRAIDGSAIVDAALLGFVVPDQIKIMVQVQRVSDNLGTAMVSQCIRKGGSYRFLRLRWVKGEPQALFRMLVGPGAEVNYHEMRISGWQKGEPKVVDLYLASKGEWLTEEIRHSLLPAVVVANKGNEDKLTAPESALLKAGPDIANAEQAGREGKPDQALAALKALPASVQEMKHILMLRARLAAEVSDEELVAAAEDTRKPFPGDCWVEVFLMNHFLGKKRFAEALKSIDQLDTCLGGDPFLQVLRAFVHNADGQREKAIECCRKAVAEEPSMVIAHMALLPAALEAKDHAQVARSLTVIEGASMAGAVPDLAKEAAYGEFLKSEEGKRWEASRKGRMPPAGELVKIPAAGPGIKAPDPATEKTCLEFFAQVEAGLKAGNCPQLDKAFRNDLIAAKVMRGLDKSDKLKEQFGDGDLRMELGRVMCFRITKGSRFKLLRIVQVGDRPRALFRVLAKGPMALDYEEFVLRVSGKGVEVVDIYTFSKGECLSDAKRWLFLSFVPMYDKAFIPQLQGTERIFVENEAKFEAMGRHAKAREFKEALATYDELPEPLRQSWAARFTRFVCALNLGLDTQECRGTIEDHYKNHDDEPWMDLWLSGIYFEKQRYDQALAVIDRLDRRVGGDPYLDFLRARAYLRQGKLVEAKERCQAVIQKEPDLIPPHETLAEVALRQKDYQQVAAVLGDLETKHGHASTDLAGLPEYAGFLGSDEGKRWQASHQKKPEPDPRPPPAN